ncbi:MAG: GNAT family N-acetyltransferase [Alphaproteobacteria bacterium]|nr:GNAT family N-acetyltransferase [Alphaproteobacteria bacterium]
MMAIKVRDFEVRLTRNKEERRMVRMLRYDVFVDEEGATPTDEQKELHEEFDDFDKYAEYMAVFHNGKIVGSYRIIDKKAADKMGGFYTETEFNISKIKKASDNIAEMSRACVAHEYRENALVMRMLWAGLSEYVLRRRIAVLFGVASWTGQKPVESAQAISYLYYNYLSPLRLRARVIPENFAAGVDQRMSKMNILPRAYVDEEIAKKQMTPLIKGYLRMGATFGQGVFIDKPFNTYDVFVMMQTKNMDAAYQKHFYGRENALEHLDVKRRPIQTLGKIMLLPITGSLNMLGAFFEFLLREDAADAEFIDESQVTDTEQ